MLCAPRARSGDTLENMPHIYMYKWLHSLLLRQGKNKRKFNHWREMKQAPGLPHMSQL